MKSPGPLYFLLVIIFALCGTGYAQSSESDDSSDGAGSTCEQYGSLGLSGGAYTVQNNEWNSSAVACVSAAGRSGFAVTQSEIALPTDGSPGGYPSIYKGCHWGNCTAESGLPLEVSAIQSAVTSWSTTQPPGGAYNAAYDVWFNQSPSTGGRPDGAELMIWLNHTGGVQPAGTAVGEVTLGGATYTVWTERQSGQNYIAYVRNRPARTVRKLDLRAFIDDAVMRGFIDPAWYLIEVEAGFEVWQGGAGLATTSFALQTAGGRSSR